MDYTALTDLEINKRVAVSLGLELREYPEGDRPLVWYTVKSDSGDDFFDYVDYKDFCNNPTDAWPIILGNRISIMFDSTLPEYEGEYFEWCDASSSCQKFGIQHQTNPLRAAMIVFLMSRS